MPNKSRFEREIDEILEKTEGKSKSEPSLKRQFEPFSPTVPKRKSPAKPGAIKFNPGTVIIAGMVILAVAAFAPFAKLPLAIVGTLLLTVGYVSWFRKGGGSFRRASGPRGTGNRPDSGPGGGGPQVKYWRGRRIEGRPEAPDLADSGDPTDRGKIIEFRPPADELEADDRGRDKE